MNRNKIRHKILRLLVENYKEVDANYGEGMGFIAPGDEYRLSIPVKEIVERLKISHEDYGTVITQAFRDKTVKHDEKNDIEDCLTIAENTFLFYNEKKYLKEVKWKENHPFLYDTILIVFASLISVVATLLVSKFQREKEQQEQNQVNIRQDSLIRELRSTLKIITDSSGIK